MKTFLEEITNEKHFDAFIQESMKLSTYRPMWEDELETDYTPSGAFNELVVEAAVASAGTVIAKNADKTIRELPDVGSIMAQTARIGDRWQLDNDRLDKLMQLEDRYRRHAGNFTNEKKGTEYAKIVKHAFGMYEPAVIAPHKRIDLLFYNGLSDGKFEVTIANNKGGITFDLDLKIPKSKLEATDALLSDHENSDPVAIINRKVKQLRAKGKIVKKVQVNNVTMGDILNSEKIKKSFTVNYGKGTVSPAGLVSEEMLNAHFKTVGLPPIEVVDVFITLPGDEEVVNAFKDNRIVFRTEDSVGKLMVKDALESKRPHPNKVYSVYKDNLISSYRTEEGDFVEYEMNAIPVFSGRGGIHILETDSKA